MNLDERVGSLTALSIVAPAVQRILSGDKRLEVRSWAPHRLPLINLALVENEHFLRAARVEEEGLLRALVDVVAVRPWSLADARAEQLRWVPGYQAWQLAHVRELAHPIPCKAKRKLYELPNLIVAKSELRPCW